MPSAAGPGSRGQARNRPPELPDPAKIRTRFPPEPNGYLHYGHAKSICLNFGLARDYAGACHLRFDDTNPEKEEQEYVDSIVDAVQWLGFDWRFGDETNLYYASNYFDWMYQFAEYLIESGHAYVDSQSADEMRASRGTLTEAGRASPYRNRSAAENLDLFRRMKAGEFADGSARAARQDRHGLGQHQPARSGHLPHQARHAPQHRRHLVHLPDVHLRPSRSRMRWRTSPIRSARSNSRTSGPSTTGCSTSWPRAGCCNGRCRSRSSSPASTFPTWCSRSAS